MRTWQGAARKPKIVRSALMNDQQNPNILSAGQLMCMNAWWRAANYLSAGQIYLLANPLLREPLRIEHVKPRLLGHWGTTPGLNFLYLHLNRIITERDLNLMFIAGTTSIRTCMVSRMRGK